MNVLILSCNTGEGHNAAGRAMKEMLESEGHLVQMIDFMELSGVITSKIVGGAYVMIAKYTPKFFGLLYNLGMAWSRSGHKSPVYYANIPMAKHLSQYLEEHEVDLIVMPHLYPAETITYMKKKKLLKQKTVAVMTDYTCIPFWEETDCDAYVIPHEDFMEEFTTRGISCEKLYPMGIPVKMEFSKPVNQEIAKARMNLPIDTPLFLIMSGSMGFGKIQLFTYELNKQCTHGEHIVVICGKNKKLQRILTREFQSKSNVHIVGYTTHVATYMAACDVVYTKPGGLTSTEVVVRNRPLVHTMPIPGCESCNMEYFKKNGLSFTALRIQDQIKQGLSLVYQEDLRQSMLCAQQKYGNPSASKQIVELMTKLCEELP